MSNTITIKAAIPSTQYIEFFDVLGVSYKLSHKDPRAKELLNAAAPYLVRGETYEVESDYLYKVHSNQDNYLKHFEAKSNGFIRFFKVAKDTLASWFLSDETPEQAKLTEAAQSIMSHAQTATSDDVLTSEETLVAVVGANTANPVAIPETEKLSAQINESVKLGNEAGVSKFLERMASVANTRQHSAKDLLTFIEKADLPICTDGTFIAYKVLSSTKDEGVYVDCHTKKVRQKVGSRVFMKETMVDHNRKADCSHGLHIARRGYLRSFSGDTIVICKIAPENVIAVPQYDANKVRVCSYDIVGLVPKDLHQILRNNKAFTSDERAAKLVGNILLGKHTHITQLVEIGGNLGTNLTITDLEVPAYESTEDSDFTVEVEAIPDVNQEVISHTEITKENLTEAVATAKVAPQAQTLTPSKPVTTSGLIRAFHEGTELEMWNAAQDLLAYKRKVKKSWIKIGLKLGDIQKMETLINSPKPEEVLATPVVKTNSQQAREMFDKGQWTYLWNLKRKVKKPFESFGFTKAEVMKIQNNKPDHI